MIFAAASTAQREEALQVWRAARTAADNPPSEQRVDRVRRKLADPSASLIVACDGEQVIAMALSEPYREDHGAGVVRPQAGHISMVFVDPERWGRGVGCRLLEAAHQDMRARDWRTFSLWTRSNNARARRLTRGEATA